MGLLMLSHDLLHGSCLEVHAYSACKCSLCVDGMQFSDRVTWAGGLRGFLVRELLHKLWAEAQRKQQAQELGQERLASASLLEDRPLSSDPMGIP